MHFEIYGDQKKQFYCLNLQCFFPQSIAHQPKKKRVQQKRLKLVPLKFRDLKNYGSLKLYREDGTDKPVKNAREKCGLLFLKFVPQAKIFLKNAQFLEIFNKILPLFTISKEKYFSVTKAHAKILVFLTKKIKFWFFFPLKFTRIWTKIFGCGADRRRRREKLGILAISIAKFKKNLSDDQPEAGEASEF